MYISTYVWPELPCTNPIQLACLDSWMIVFYTIQKMLDIYINRYLYMPAIVVCAIVVFCRRSG